MKEESWDLVRATSTEGLSLSVLCKTCDDQNHNCEMVSSITIVRWRDGILRKKECYRKVQESKVTPLVGCGEKEEEGKGGLLGNLSPFYPLGKPPPPQTSGILRKISQKGGG